MIRIVLLLILLLLIPALVAAQTVGPTCTFLWDPPTKDVNGAPLLSPVTFYNLWIKDSPTPVPVPGVTPVTATVAAPTTLWDCSKVSPNVPHFAWVSAWNSLDSGISTASTAVPPVPAVPLAFTFVPTLPTAAPGPPINPRVTK